MREVLWFLVLGAAAALAFWAWHWHRRWSERERAAEERHAAFLAEAAAAAMPAKPPADPRERLLFDAAARAAQAGEPVLAIQLYARLLSRFPKSALAEQARVAVEAQKKNVAKA